MKTTFFSLSFLFTLLLVGCQESPLEGLKYLQAEKTGTAHQTETLPDLSVYHLGSDWTTQDGKSMKLQALQGKPVLVSLIYTSCTFACPRTVADLQIIERGLAEFKTDDFRVLVVTIDPERDTPAQLQKFAGQYGFNLNRWTLLTNRNEEIQELAAVLNVKYRKALQGEFAHSNLITVLNAQGEVVHQQQGLGAAPDETIAVVKGLLATK